MHIDSQQFTTIGCPIGIVGMDEECRIIIVSCPTSIVASEHSHCNFAAYHNTRQESLWTHPTLVHRQSPGGESPTRHGNSQKNRHGSSTPYMTW